MSDERARYKQKPESKKGGDSAAEEKEGVVSKGTADDKVEKKGSKVKGDKKSSVPAREGRLFVTEGSAPEEGTAKDLKKEKIPSETTKEKIKGVKSLGIKTDSKQQLRLDPTVPTEERSEGEAASDFNRKKDKQAKDILRRSKSHPEVKSLDKVNARQDGKDVGAGRKDKSSTSEAQKHSSDTKIKNSESGAKVKSVSEKPRSKSRDDLKPQSPLLTKTDKKTQGQEAKDKAGTPPCKTEFSKEKKKEGAMKEYRRVSEDRVEKGKDAKSTKKTSEKKTKENNETEKRISEADELSSSSSVPSAVAEEVQNGDETASQPSGTQAQQVSESLTTSDLTTQQDSDSLGESDLKTPQVLESLTETPVSTAQGMDSAVESNSTDQSNSESLRRSDLTSDSQAMDTVSDLAALQSTDVEVNLKTPQTMDTEPEPSKPQTIDTESDLASPRASAAKSDLASPPVCDVPKESPEELQSEPIESGFATTPLLQSSVSALTVHHSETSHLATPQSSDSTPASLIKVPESSDSIPESDLTVTRQVFQGPDVLPNPVPADANSTSVPDDMYDALSDITPDPDDDEEAAMRLAESQPQPRPIPAEADALLSLMDVCTSAAARTTAIIVSDAQEAESSFRDADLKMKEAALTLLSMDPDQAVLQSFVAEDSHVSEQPMESLASDLVDVTSAKEPSKEAADESESESSPRDSDAGDNHTEGSAFCVHSSVFQIMQISLSFVFNLF